MRIILASQSPSRAAILRAAGVEPVLAPANVDERSVEQQLHGSSPADIVAALAQAKARAIAAQYGPEAVIIGADSMLLMDGQLYGKPHTVQKTIERWQQQSGRSAQLITGHCLIFGQHEYVEVASTTVHFASASAEDIAAYARSGEPLECAGAFTLEALGGWFIDSIEGDPSCVIGLSLPAVRRGLYSFGLSVSEFWG